MPGAWTPGEFRQHVVNEVRDGRAVVQSAGVKLE
jgi:hypothetical protein